MAETVDDSVRELAVRTRKYLAEELPQNQTPRITNNPDVWLQECVAILSETSIEMVSMMAKNPQEIAPFMRVFAMVTTLAADSKKLLQQGGGQPPPIAPPGGAGDNGGMEKRFEAIEKDVREVRERLVRVETKVDGIEKKVAELPSKEFVTVAVSGSSNKIILWVIGVVRGAQFIPALLRMFDKA